MKLEIEIGKLLLDSSSTKITSKSFFRVILVLKVSK
jgi:hypothetical protein